MREMPSYIVPPKTEQEKWEQEKFDAISIGDIVMCKDPVTGIIEEQKVMGKDSSLHVIMATPLENDLPGSSYESGIELKNIVGSYTPS